MTPEHEHFIQSIQRNLLQPILLLYNILALDILAHHCVCFDSYLSALYIGGFWPNKKFFNKPSILLQQDSMGFGRDNRIWVNYEISKLLITMILPSKFKRLGVKILISCLISLILLFKFNCYVWHVQDINKLFLMI